MDLPNVEISLSTIDTERWGVQSARARNVLSSNLSKALQFCEEHSVKFLTARCPTSELKSAQDMEQAGFQLMDTLVYYSRKLDAVTIPEDTGQVLIRPVRSGDEDQVRSVASDSFKGYFGHYHADPRLNRKDCDDTYTSWAYRSCISRDVADEVLIADMNGDVAGFATLRLNSPEECEGVLFGVAPSAQGKGIYRSFMIQAMHWGIAQGRTRMIVSTQVNNIAVQKVWTRVGFEPSSSYYTFHKWFD
ncbi:MAG: GNAT family N-acetyltransferase [Candidatus Hydrogenedentes bacterium]|nr:GNAT family N-acetyltransferase [Candidatus Hydrogenedentota bacterium]